MKYNSQTINKNKNKGVTEKGLFTVNVLLCLTTYGKTTDHLWAF